MPEFLDLFRLLVAALATATVIGVLLVRQKQVMHILWGVFSFSLATTLIADTFGDRLGAMQYVLAIGGAGTCSVFWLVSRGLFRGPTPVKPMHLMLVAAVFMPTLIIQLMLLFSAPAAMGADNFATVRTGLGQFQLLVCSTALVLAFWEGVRGWRADLPVNERRLRFLFLSTYGLCLVVCQVWPEDTSAGNSMTLLETSAALSILIMVGIGVAYRTRNPLPEEPEMRPVRILARRAEPDAEETALAARIERLVIAEQLYLEADLKVAGLAKRLHEPDYKVTRALTGALGAKNFNQFINRHRIEHAKTMLERGEGNSILDVGLASGFASIGPFNRAFKALVGVTPRQYRAGLGGDIGVAAE